MFLKNWFVIFVAIVVVTATALVSPVKAHWEQVWVQDQPSGHWDQALVATPYGNRYKAMWVQDPPSGRYQAVWVNDPVCIVPVIPVYIYAPPVYVGPYYGGRGYHGGHHYRR